MSKEPKKKAKKSMPAGVKEIQLICDSKPLYDFINRQAEADGRSRNSWLCRQLNLLKAKVEAATE